MEDVYKQAARFLLDGDKVGAWKAIEQKVVDNCNESYEPEFDADEDGQYVEYKNSSRHKVYQEIDFSVDAIASALWEIMTAEQGVDDADAVQISSDLTDNITDEWHDLYSDDIADELVDNWVDNNSYSDPYAYYGVRRSDF